ncbi:MAG: PadR family transcriptional regulator [Ilumatobacteraceae bacterium]
MHHRHFHHAEHDRGGYDARDPRDGGRGPRGRGRGSGRRGGPFSDGGGGRHRARRGAVQASILTLLAERPMNGYELITELETRSEGRWRPSPGAIYPALSKMEERGAISSTMEATDGSAGKLQFELTERGRTMLAYYNEEQGEGAAPPWGAAPSEGGGDLRGQLFELVGQARRLRRVGTSDQVRRASAIIAEATVKLTAVADETPSDSPDTDTAVPTVD